MSAHRNILGVSFKVHSPCVYELIAFDDGSDLSLVTVSFDGARWYIDVLMKRGHSVRRGPFVSRDDAISLLANRRAA